MGDLNEPNEAPAHQNQDQDQDQAAEHQAEGWQTFFGYAGGHKPQAILVVEEACTVGSSISHQQCAVSHDNLTQNQADSLQGNDLFAQSNVHIVVLLNSTRCATKRF